MAGTEHKSGASGAGDTADWRATRIFVSHSHADNAFGLRLVADLRRVLGSEESVWYDAAGGLQGGDAWWRTIREELAARPVFLVLVSPASMDSIWVNNEIDMAWAQRNATRDAAGRPAGKRILPVLVDNATPRTDLATLHEDMVSFVPPASYEQSLRTLLDRLGVPKGAEHASSPPPPTLPVTANTEGGLALTRLALHPPTKDGMSRRKVITVGGAVAAVVVVGGLADLMLTHGAGRQGAKPTATMKSTPVGTPRATPLPSRLRWVVSGNYTGGQFPQFVAGPEGTVCLTNSQGSVVVDAATGHNTSWHFAPDKMQASSEIGILATTSGYVVGSLGPGDPGETYGAYGLAANGQKLWTMGSTTGPVVLCCGVYSALARYVYVSPQNEPPPPSGSTPTNVIVLDATTGAQLAAGPLPFDAYWYFCDGQYLIAVGSGIAESNGPWSGWMGLDPSSLAIRWSADAPFSQEFAAPAVGRLVNGVLYLVSQGGRVAAYNAADNSAVWGPVLVSNSPLGVNTLAYAPFAVAPQSGTVAWLAVAGQSLVVALQDGHLTALDATSGTVRWQKNLFAGTQLASSLTCAPTIGTPSGSGASVLYVGDNNGILHALSMTDGALLWTTPPFQGSYICSPLLIGDTIVATDGNGTLYGYSASA